MKALYFIWSLWQFKSKLLSSAIGGAMYYEVKGDHSSVCDYSSRKAIEQYFHAVLFIMLSKVFQTFKSMDKTLECDHWSKSYLVFNF